eukprot:Em0004g732a
MALCKLCGRLPPSVKDTRRLDASATSLVVKLATSACVDPTPFCEGTVCKTCYFQLHRLIKLEHQYSKLRDEFVARMVATVPAISEHQLQHPSRRPQRNQVAGPSAREEDLTQSAPSPPTTVSYGRSTMRTYVIPPSKKRIIRSLTRGNFSATVKHVFKVPLGVLPRNENQLNEMILIMESMHKYCPNVQNSFMEDEDDPTSKLDVDCYHHVLLVEIN